MKTALLSCLLSALAFWGSGCVSRMIGVSIFDGTPTQESLNTEARESAEYLSIVAGKVAEAQNEALTDDQRKVFNEAFVMIVELSDFCRRGPDYEDYTAALREVQCVVDRFTAHGAAATAHLAALTAVLTPYLSAKPDLYRMVTSRKGSIFYYPSRYATEKKWRMGAAALETTKPLMK